jgi:hypothetical protein
VHANKCLLAASLLPSTSSMKAHASSSAADQDRVTVITDSSQEQQQLDIVEETRPTHEVINIDDSPSPPLKRAPAALSPKIENFFKRQVP